MATHADVTAQLDSVMIHTRLYLTYFSTIFLMVTVVLSLWTTKPLVEYTQQWRWWFRLTPLVPLFAAPVVIGLIRLALTGNDDLLAAAPGIILNIWLVTLLVAVLGGGLWDALNVRHHRFLR